MSSVIASLLLHGTTASLVAAANLQQMIFWNSIGIRVERRRARACFSAVGLAIDAILSR
jgi:ribosomal protein L12E/L44/L45/RPP1/RPP2